MAHCGAVTPCGTQRAPERTSTLVATRKFEAKSCNVALVRRFVSVTLASWGLKALEPLASLLTSELATNAVRHARTRFAVAIALDSRELRVQVIDGSKRLPREGKTTTLSSSGRGLMIVRAVASQYGVEVLNGGKSVWFTLSLDGRAPESVEREAMVTAQHRGHCSDKVT